MAGVLSLEYGPELMCVRFVQMRGLLFALDKLSVHRSFHSAQFSVSSISLGLVACGICRQRLVSKSVEYYFKYTGLVKLSSLFGL